MLAMVVSEKGSWLAVQRDAARAEMVDGVLTGLAGSGPAPAAGQGGGPLARAIGEVETVLATVALDIELLRAQRQAVPDDALAEHGEGAKEVHPAGRAGCGDGQNGMSSPTPTGALWLPAGGVALSGRGVAGALAGD